MKKADLSVSFLIPTHNDESTIAEVLLETERIAKKHTKAFEIIVINDASTDKTQQILRSLTKTIPSLRVITHVHNKGYGGTIRELYYAGKMDWLFTLPGDGQIRASEFPKLLSKVKVGDFILGWRTIRHDTEKRKQQSYIYNWLVRRLLQIKIHDINSVRLIKRKLIQSLTLETTSAFVDAELTIKAIRHGAKVIEVPILHTERAHEGASGGRLDVIWPTFRDLILFYFKSLG